MPPHVDDGSIADYFDLLRRVRPDQIVDDQNRGERRPSSAAFKDPEMSVDAEQILQQNGLNFAFSLRNNLGFSLARFKAGVARANNLPVISKPESDNPAHAEVHGKKTRGIANNLVAACTWAHLEPKPAGETSR
jgi:hypothetical protein